MAEVTFVNSAIKNTENILQCSKLCTTETNMSLNKIGPRVQHRGSEQIRIREKSDSASKHNHMSRAYDSSAIRVRVSTAMMCNQL